MAISQKVCVRAEDQDLTSGWKTVGGEMNVEYKRTFAVWVELDINDSENVQIRAIAKYESGGDGYPLPIKAVTTSKITVKPEYIELSDDSDQKMILSFALDKAIPILQIQAKAGTVGGTAGKITMRSTVGGY